MYPIATNINRRCVKQTNINGIDIPKDLIILVDVLSIHNDFDVWGTFMETTEFYPKRFSKEYKRHPASFFGFGLGPRNCVGIKFAYNEMKLVMVNILSSFEVIESDLSPDKLEFIDGTAVRSVKNDIFITLKKRN
jgi:cytochrome P450